MQDNVYGLNYGVKSFAVSNEFAVTMNKVSYRLGKSLQPFCFFASEAQKEAGVLDFTQFVGLAGGTDLLSEVVSLRAAVYRDAGIAVTEESARLLFFDYLMTIAVCYVEVDKYTHRDGYNMHTYDKFFCTRNPNLMAAWVGSDTAEMQARYSSRIAMRFGDVASNQLRLVKLTQTSKGNSISVPRSGYEVDKMTCYPLFMLNTFKMGLTEVMQQNILKFTFLKDNGTLRELVSTLNPAVWADYYPNNPGYVQSVLAGVDYASVKQGSMQVGSKMHRGYIKIPELGTSIYDDTGLRSLNLSRILKVEKVEGADRTYIQVDLNAVVDTFKQEVIKSQIKKQYIRMIYRDITGKEPDERMSDDEIVTALFLDVDGKLTFLSTTFQRSLHSYMISHPEIFAGYTGYRTSSKNMTSSVVSSADFGVAPIDF